MSEIYPAPEVDILSGNVTFKPKVLIGTCEFCFGYTHNGYNLLNKIVCEQCREKLLKRINLIMNFE